MFTYGNLLDEMQRFCRFGAETGIVGESELGQAIPYVFVGKKNGNNMIVQGAMHAREHLTALLVVCQAKYLLQNPDLRLDGGIYFVPMVNPDGVRLCQEGANWIEGDAKREAIAVNRGLDFSLWKANAKGVDLNVNFDADWGQGEQNEFAPAPSNFVGKEPFCAAETRAIRDFTLMLDPRVTLSYHLKGEEIYWQFGQTGADAERDEKLANAVASYTGYAVKRTPNSVGGYKDWCVKTFGIPSFTVEVGDDRFPHPFPYSQFRSIYDRNVDLPRRLLNTVIRIS